MLSAAHILADPSRPIVSGLGPFTFFHLTRSLVLYGLDLTRKSIAQPKACAPHPITAPPPHFQSRVAVFSQALPGLRDTGDERIGCAETIAVGERFFSGTAEHVHVML